MPICRMLEARKSSLIKLKISHTSWKIPKQPKNLVNKELIEEVEYLQINNRRLKSVTTRLNMEMIDESEKYG